MILYNTRYRGPFEYDKSILNALQFSNEVSNMIESELTKNNDFTAICDYADTVNDFFKFFVGDPNNVGISEQIYYELLHYKEC